MIGQNAAGLVQARLGLPTTGNDSDNNYSKLASPAPEGGVPGEPAQVLTLAQAIDTAFYQQPRLRVFLESVEQARRGEDIAVAPFLPLAVAGYSAGGFDLNVGGNSAPLGPLPGFTFLPALGSLPMG